MRRENAPVTVALSLVLIAVFGLELAFGGGPVCAAWGLVPATFDRTGSLVPLFTYGLLHDPQAPLGHLGGNVLVLLLAGPVVEREIGSVRFAALYVAAGVFGGLLHVAVDPSSGAALVGASGSIAGILAALGALRPRFIGFAIGFALVNVYWALTGAGGAVSFATHIGGFATGIFFVTIMRTTFVEKERFA